MITVDLIGNREGLDRLAEPWRALADSSPSSSVFQTWQWQRTWWRHLSRGARPFLLLVQEGDRPFGIAPFARRRIAGLPLRRLEFSGAGVSDYLDFLFSPGDRERFWQGVCEGLARFRGRWDLLELHQIPDGSPTLSEFPAACQRLGWQVEVLPQEVCPRLALPPSWEGLLASYNKKSRFRINYYRRLAERELSVAWRLAQTQEEVAEAMEHLFSLHSARWRQRGLPGMLFEGRKRRFHQEVAGRFFREDWLRLYLATNQDRVAAALYCFDYKNVVYYYLSGFHPDYARYSLGTVLVGRAIEQAIEEGRSRFDFLRGPESYKYQWGAQDRVNWSLRVIPPGPRPRWAAGLARVGQRLESQAKRSLRVWLSGRRTKKGSK